MTLIDTECECYGVGCELCFDAYEDDDSDALIASERGT